MNADEKIKLLTDANEALCALGRIVDGGHTIPPRLYAACMDTMAGLSFTAARLEAEVGTDAINRARKDRP
jgi:hypothetical protein